MPLHNRKCPSQMVRVSGRGGTMPEQLQPTIGLTWEAARVAAVGDHEIPLRVTMSATSLNLFVVTVGGGRALRTADNGASWQSVWDCPIVIQDRGIGLDRW